MTNKEHRAPWECTYAKEDKSRCKPGNKPKSDREYFEILCLCILQAGLNWNMVREKWLNIKQGILLDEDKHENLLLNLFQGYALIDMFNNKRIEFEKDLQSGDEEIFSEIAIYLKNVHDEISTKVKSVKL